MRCPRCSSSNVEVTQQSGDCVCTDCGCVLEENALISSVEFQETAGGSRSGGCARQHGRYGTKRD